MNYGSLALSNDRKETRAYDPFNASLGTATGGMVLMLGDATASLATRGDLVLAGTGDPGRTSTENASAFTYDGTSYGTGAMAGSRCGPIALRSTCFRRVAI